MMVVMVFGDIIEDLLMAATLMVMIQMSKRKKIRRPAHVTSCLLHYPCGGSFTMFA